jgi:chromosome segregation ATPase
MRFLLLAVIWASPAQAEETASKSAPRSECSAKEKPGDFVGCVAPLKEIADGYKQAETNLLVWMKSASDRVQAVFDEEKKLRDKIKENRNAITELKFESNRANKRKAKALERENKSLWKDLKGVKRRKRNACRSVEKELDAELENYANDLKSRIRSAKKDLP